jgi:mRNA interferase RelE/StbE
VTYTVELAPRARKQLGALDNQTRVRIVGKLTELAGDPRPPGCKKLKGEDNLWRVRAGDYRIVFEIHDDVLPAEEGVEEAWEQELARRAKEIDSGAVKLEPWSKVRQELDDIVRGS